MLFSIFSRGKYVSMSYYCHFQQNQVFLWGKKKHLENTAEVLTGQRLP